MTPLTTGSALISSAQIDRLSVVTEPLRATVSTTFSSIGYAPGCDWRNGSSAARNARGNRAGRPAGVTKARRTASRAIVVAPRLTICSRSALAPPSAVGRVNTSSLSSSRAGRR